jgi:apolipoprotein N-acyltransferase
VYRSDLVPGEAPPTLGRGARPEVTLICYEVFSRSLVLEGKRAGGVLLTVLASDRAIHGSAVAMQQILGALVLRSVESGLPAVRASLRGSAALISADGRILGMTRPGTSAVLTVPSGEKAGDAPPHATPAVPQMAHGPRV